MYAMRPAREDARAEFEYAPEHTAAFGKLVTRLKETRERQFTGGALPAWIAR
jgi:hypothetical protein